TMRTWFDADKNPAGHIINYRGRAVKSVRTSYATAKRKAGITRRLRLYDFRHAFATALLSGGADLKSTSELIGHSRTDTTTRIYQHTNFAMHRAAVGILKPLEQPVQQIDNVVPFKPAITA
ncbi:tyrosine-type recombinase/integrase, partial [Thermodesulfobacteriota bacterium]